MPDEPLPAGAQPFATDEGAADAQRPPKEPGGGWRLFDRLVVVVFALVLVLPAVLLVARVHVKDVENRAPRPLPELTLGALADASWAAGVDGFLTDRLWPRPYAIRLRGAAYWLSGGSGNPEVIRGVGDWLFIRDELQPTCRFTVQQQTAALQRAATALAQRGIEFRFLIAPDKHAVYPDKLRPGNPFPTACTDANRPALDAALAGLGGVAIDATAALQAARSAPGTSALFYDQDTHWTPVGAAAAVDELARSFGPGVWSPEDVQIKGTKRRLLDTPGLLGLRNVAVTPRVVMRPDVQLHRVDVQVPVQVHNARTIFRITATGDDRILPGRTLVVYDSFFGIDTTLVAPYFGDTTWLHNEDLIAHPELVKLLGPFDRVIVERVSRSFMAVDLDALLGPLAAP